MNTKILKPVIVILFMFIFASCTKNDYINSYNKQMENIEAYVETLKDTTTSVRINDTYVVTVREGLGKPAEQGDSLYIRYEVASFTTKPVSLIYSNIIPEEPEEEPEENPEEPEDDKPTVPKEDPAPFGIKVGTSDLIDGLNNGIQEITEGEHRYVIMPFTEAYGDKWNNTVPPYTAIWMQIFVEKIVRN